MKKLPNLNISSLIFFLCCNTFTLLAQVQLIRTPYDGPASELDKSSPFFNAPLTYKIIEVPNNTFGFEIYADSHLIFHQAHIPGIPRNEGLKTRENSITAALVAIQKLKHRNIVRSPDYRP